MHIEGLRIEYYPPYKSLGKTIDFVSLEDEIAFMTRFYPPPKFLKLTLEQTSANGLQLSDSQISYSISSKSVNQSQIQAGSLKNVSDIKGYDMSEIKALTKGIVANSKNHKGKELKQFDQSEFEYRQLLDELSFSGNHIKEPFSSQKYRDQKYYFQLSEGEESFVSEQKMDYFSQPQNNQGQFNLKKSKTTKLTTEEFRWNPYAELLFIKKNRLQGVFWILSKPTISNYRLFMDKLIDAQKYLKPLFTCLSCQTKFKRKNRKKKCQNCQDRKKNQKVKLNLQNVNQKQIVR